ncbi:ABC transporter substrate-binding protein [Haloferax sp. DFSO52]|uniref:ABC transporter substrate-binding protein n=1 Tax=Haloferax sp. DFSO52 TaxID=3388505 RepID=UPI003A842596
MSDDSKLRKRNTRSLRTSTPSRRRFLQAAGVTGTAGLAGCLGSLGGGGGGGGGSGNHTIKFWTLFGGGDGVVMKSMVDKFNEEKPLGDGVTIDRQRLEWDTYYDKLFTSMTGGQPPDLAISHMAYLNRFGDVITPYNEYVDVDAMNNEFLDSHMNAVTIDGEVRSMPLDFHPIGIYYNKDVFADAGLDPESPPSNWDEFKAAGDAIVSNTDAYAFASTPYMDGVGNFRTWSSFVKQAGGSLFTDDLSQANFNNEAGQQVTEMWSKMTSDWGWAAATSEENWGNKTFQNGNLGMVANGTWYVNVMAELEDFNWGFFKPYVGPGDQKATWADGHSLIMPQNPNRNDEKTEVTAQVANWLASENPEWGAEAGHLPACNRYYDEGLLEESPYWDKTLKKYLEMAESQAYFPHPQVNGDPNSASWWSWLVDVWAQNSEPQAAIQSGIERINSDLSE